MGRTVKRTRWRFCREESSARCNWRGINQQRKCSSIKLVQGTNYSLYDIGQTQLHGAYFETSQGNERIYCSSDASNNNKEFCSRKLSGFVAKFDLTSSENSSVIVDYNSIRGYVCPWEAINNGSIPLHLRPVNHVPGKVIADFFSSPNDLWKLITNDDFELHIQDSPLPSLSKILLSECVVLYDDPKNDDIHNPDYEFLTDTSLKTRKTNGRYHYIEASRPISRPGNFSIKDCRTNETFELFYLPNKDKFIPAFQSTNDSKAPPIKLNETTVHLDVWASSDYDYFCSKVNLFSVKDRNSSDYLWMLFVNLTLPDHVATSAHHENNSSSLPKSRSMC